uniref:Uncharacterized protein n=1 Tax=Anopheles culicifacies TaxID=139723 RepID=A0A182M428_9DIPT
MLKELLVVICIWMYLFDFTKGVLEPVIKECNLTPAIEKLIQQHSHRYLPNASPEACIVTTNVSTLSESHPFCFIIDHPKIVQFFDDEGIVNYAIVQMPFSDFHSVDRFYVYTQNRFSKEKIVVRLSDIRNMHRLYPNKLANLYGHHIRIGVKQDDFPYVSISKNPDEIDGFLSQMFRDLGERILNLSFTIFHQNTEQYDADVYYDIIFQREHFQHITYTSRVLALMSLRTFYKRPKTIAEFMQSDIMMVIHKQDLLQYPLDDFLPKMLSLEEFDELRGRTGPP